MRRYRMTLAMAALAASVLVPVTTTRAESLGLAGNYAVFALGKTIPNNTYQSFMEENDTTDINGSVAIGPNGLVTDGKKGNITGNVNVDSTASWNTGGIVVGGSVLTGQNLSTARQDALSASTAAGLLAPTINPPAGSGAVTGPQTFNRTGAETVIKATNWIVGGGGQTITLNGTANDRFVINVSGAFSVAGGDVALTGGLTANHVLFNITGTGLVEILGGTTSVDGTVLAPNRVINMGAATVNGAVIAGLNANPDGTPANASVNIHSDATINFQPFDPPVSVVPLPATAGGIAVAMAALAMGRLRRARNTA